MLLWLFPGRRIAEDLGGFLIVVPVLSFVLIYLWKAHSDPDFCRSETHVQRLKKIELEMMGTETRQIEGEVLEGQALLNSVKDLLAIGDNRSDEGDK